MSLPPRASAEGEIAVPQWAAQQLFWSERCRGRALLWPRGADWFSNDPLGHAPHTHPDASEIYFVAAGRARVTVGRTDVELGPGGYLLIPADTYHDPMNAGLADLCLFVVVAPNWRERRWKPDGFDDNDFRGTPCVDDVGTDGPLPSDARLSAAVLRLEPGTEENVDRQADADRIIYVLQGEAEVEVGRLAGKLQAHEYLLISGFERHRLRSLGRERLRYLSIWARDPA